MKPSRALALPVLALDFDGVICSSSAEVVLVASRTYLEMMPASILRTDLLDLESRAALGAEAVEASRFAAAFRPLLPLGNGAADFAVALTAIERDVELGDQETYDHFARGLDPALPARFQEHFFQVRATLRESDPERWIALHRPYASFVDVLCRRHNDAVLAIATAKDSASVRLLLERFGASGLFPDELLLDKDTGRSKTAHLRLLAERLRVDLAAITFVDDKVNHLEAVAGLGVRPVLAGWGHNTAREHRRAEDLGFAVASLESAEAILFGP